ncbi:YqhA family protein [Lichenifustis flavocetrariae]|uniref:YqhA family protein n=1 Tax=Lichenifustis flavocetrariae TaxID=2949735 RepID=A0AA41ZAS8_9HYPH|nr:YqhA family protein [Lichenifustis flavocetrariae]MCW6512462.1 YqhA family protein [Lichenifustis flavocetrariae]
MLSFALSFRYILAVAILGMAAGAVLMFWEGGLEIRDAVLHTWLADGTKPSVITDVMEATDKFLFGIVLVIFAFAITFGFLVELSGAARARLPRWMNVTDVGELKHVFFEVILVYLAVDFVTDIARSEDHREWTELVVPAAILLLATAIRLLAGTHPKASQHGNDKDSAAEGPRHS